MKKAVLISCFDWYLNRLQPIKEQLEYNYDVEVYLADYDHIKKQPYKLKERGCTYITVPEYKSNISLKRMYSHWKFGVMIWKKLNEVTPDLIYVLIPPNSAAYQCSKYVKKHNNCKCIYDVIDLWPESMPLGRLNNSFFAYSWRKLRNNALINADYVFTECNLYREQLKNIIVPDKTSTLYLFKEQKESEKKQVMKYAKSNKILDGTIKFAYLGSMNNIIDIAGICRVLGDLISQGFSCELHAIGDGESRKKFEEMVGQTGCKTFFYGKIFDEYEKINILAPCDYAFNMMKNSVIVGLTIKSIDYLSYGLPLVNNIKGDTWKLINDENIGVNVENSSLCIHPIDHLKVIRVFNQRFTKQSFIDSFKNAFSGVRHK